jgi:DNA end-binding protein Ku
VPAPFFRRVLTSFRCASLARDPTPRNEERGRTPPHPEERSLTKEKRPAQINTKAGDHGTWWNYRLRGNVDEPEGKMAQRPIWRGYLKLALVTCPVALYSVNHDRGSLHFNMINPKTGNRIKMITQDAETEDEVSRRDLVKGYEYKKDNYLVLTDEDFENARVESSSTITIDKFVDVGSIDPIYFDASYYMGPDGKAGIEVFTVLREAIAATGKIALARVVIARRERAIGIMPMGKILVAHTLHEDRDLNDAGALFDELPDAKVDPQMLRLAEQLIDRQVGKYDPSDVEDRYETRLREVINAKLKGEGVEPEAEVEPDRSNVVDLMSALRRSLNQDGDKEPSPPAKTRKAAASKTGETTKTSPSKKPGSSGRATARRRA